MEVYRGAVAAEWIDINRHMNVAYYTLAFDLGVDALWAKFGLTRESVAATGGSTFAVECHLTYQAELEEDQRFLITSEILAYDAKRLHQFQRMYRETDAALVATCEWMNLSVNLEVRRVAPWANDIEERIRAIAEGQQPAEWPAEAGRQMTVRRPLFTLYPDYPSEVQS